MKKETEAEFQAGLAKRLLESQQAQGSPSENKHRTVTADGMHMNEVPMGKSKSLDELMSQSNNADEATSPPLLGIISELQAGPTLPNVGSTPSEGVIVRIPLQCLADSPWQPRVRYDETALMALGETLLDRGQDEPITVRQIAGGKYELISGHRRTRAARMIGWASLEAKIVVKSDDEAELATLVSNESHEGLSEYEKAVSYKKALDRGFAKDQAGVARLFSCSQARVSQCLSLLKLPVPFLGLLERYPGLFGFRYAKVIVELLKTYPDNADTVIQGAEKLIDNPDLSEDDLRTFVARALHKRIRSANNQPTIIPDRSGASLFTVRIRDKQIVIDIKDGFDPNLVSKRTAATLREIASTVGKDEE